MQLKYASPPIQRHTPPTLLETLLLIAGEYISLFPFPGFWPFITSLSGLARSLFSLIPCTPRKHTWLWLWLHCTVAYLIAWLVFFFIEKGSTRLFIESNKSLTCLVSFSGQHPGSHAPLRSSLLLILSLLGTSKSPTDLTPSRHCMLYRGVCV